MCLINIIKFFLGTIKFGGNKELKSAPVATGLQCAEAKSTWI